MTERGTKLLQEEIAELGPVRLRDCHAAQATLVRLAKTLADRGEITLISPKRDGRLVY
jgi:flagellar motor switch protein FliG